MKNLLLLVAFLALPVWCQLDNGIIEGTVRDATGATVPKAAVTITETQTNNRFEVVADGQGNYVSPPLKVGNYRVSVEAAGFKIYTRAGIVLQVQDRLRVDAALEVGSRTEVVMVTGEVPPVQTDTSALGQVITRQQLVDMPLNGRNYANLAVLTTGVIDTSSGANGNQAGSFSSNGARGDLNNYVLDGIDNNSNDGGGALAGVNMEAIAEFKIQTNAYDAEFGRSGGAALNVVSKTGTNQIHGSVFEFYQNAYLNAQSFFSVTRPLSTKYNQPGGALGFPIIKNKLFFFGDWQMTDSHKPAVDKSSVPVGSEATGNFNGISGVHTIYDPTTYNAATGARSPFPNNIIPIDEISPLGLAYASLYPQPNVPGATKNNYIIEPTSLSQSMQGDGRMDYRISDADQVFGRYTQAGSTNFSAPKMGGLACGCGYSSGNTFSYTKLGSLGETHTFTPTTLNEFRVGFNWNYNHDGVPQGGFPAVPSNLQIPGVVNDPSWQGIANMAPSTYSSLGIALFIPSGASSQERQIRDTLNLIRGRHTLRIGGEMRWTEYQLFQLTSPRGSYSFTGQYTSKAGAGGSTGNGLADMLVGIPLQSSITSYAYVGNRQKVPAVFVQDDWKVSHNLTLNLGLRYEYYQPTVDVHNHQANFNYTTGQLDVAGVNGNSRSLTNGQNLTFAPRVGLAYTPVSDTVIRAGFGIFYSGQEVRTGDPLQLQYNLPFFYEPLFVGDGVTPTLTLPQGFPPLNPSQAINPSVTSVDSPTEKTPYYEQWNVAVQRALPGKMSLEVAYAGSRGVHLQGLTDQNQDRVPGPGDVQARRPYPFYGGFASIQDRGNSNFNSMQIKLQKFLTRGLYFLSSYTFSRAIDDLVPICCNTPWPDDSYNLSLLKGLSDYQAKNRWVTSFDYALPFGKGATLLNTNSKVLDLIVGGWHWSGIFTMASGFPFTPQISYDSSNTGTQGFTNPDRVGNGNISGSQRTINNWFNVEAFQDPTGYVFGNSGYNVLIGPGLINLDFGLRKIFNISERQKLQLRLEGFNALNHPNFGLPDNNIDDLPASQGGTAGVITGLRGGNRVTQIGMTYRF